MLILVAPGQGAQTPGFLTPWLDADGVTDHLHHWSTLTGLDLTAYGTTADADTIRDTAIAQPLLVAAGLATAPLLGAHPANAVAGHSVGELTAAALAGVISPEATLGLVRERGLAMAQAATTQATGMTAILGGDPDTVLAHLAGHGLSAANHNGAGQIVAAGTQAQLAALAADPPAKARLRPLAVAGAFHTRHMAPAADHLAACITGLHPADPHPVYVSNADGQVVRGGAEVLTRLVSQVARPVRWDLCMATMAALGVTAVIELPPAGTLTGLIRRTLPGVQTLALNTPDDLDLARKLITEHTHPAGQESTPDTGREDAR